MKIKTYSLIIIAILAVTLATFNSPFKIFLKQDQTAAENKKEISTSEKLNLPPIEFYQLDQQAIKMYFSTLEQNWQQSIEDFEEFNLTWTQTKEKLANTNKIDDIEKIDEKMPKLQESLKNKNMDNALENLINIMSDLSSIGEYYQLSPIPDILGINNALYAMNYYVIKDDWEKAETKMKELEKMWSFRKTSLEKVGILGEVTTMHDQINKIQHSIETKNKELYLKRFKSATEAMAKITNFCYGK